jgi:hypothetical protein
LEAFVFTIRDGVQARCICLGWDRERCAGLPILPALLHAAIEDSLSMECAELDFGRTALKAKAQVGAHPRATETWVQQQTVEHPALAPELVGPIAHSPVPDPALTVNL